MANSAFFGFPREVRSLQQALTILGFKEIQNLVLARAVFNSFKNIKKNGAFDINQFWEHSFVCGLLSKIIANDIQKDNNEFFVAGLIHDIGKLIIFLAMPVEYDRIIQSAKPMGFKMLQEEQQVLDLSHDEVGMKLLRKWLFPESLISAVEFHHNPHGAKSHSLLPIVVHGADLLAHLVKLENPHDNPQLMEFLLRSDFVTLAQANGLEWNEDALINFQRELEKRMDENATTLNLLLS